MDLKKLAMVIGIAALLPLFIGLFMDAVYTEPRYDKYCNESMYAYPAKIGTNCTYQPNPLQDQCYRDQGSARMKFDANGCETFDKCDYCSKDYSNAQQMYNRNLFFILMPVGLIIVILGIYLLVDYIGAGLMFAGLITMFYATIRYFTDMSKLLRAIVILIELLIIMWIGYKKIGRHDEERVSVKKKEKGKKHR
ncbi:MAG: hypothetical protein WC916_03770 [Candidatus Woesearchaeota archaeon]